MIRSKTQLMTMPMSQLAGLLPMLQWQLDPGGYLEAWLIPGEMKVRIHSSKLYRGPTRLIRMNPFHSSIQVVAGLLEDHRYRGSTQIGPTYQQLAVLPDGRLSRRGLVRLVARDTETYPPPQVFDVPAGAVHWLEARWAVALVAINDVKAELPMVYTSPDVPLPQPSPPASPLLWQPLIQDAAQAILELSP